MRLRLTSIALLALLVLAGCAGSPPAPPGTTDGLVANESTGDRVPPVPDRPDRLTADAVAAYANATETHRLYRDAVAEGATDVDVTCSGSPVALGDAAGYALVDCDGSVYRGDSVDSTQFTAFYRVTTDGETRIERVSSRDEGGDADRRLRVYNLGDERRSLSVSLSPAGSTGADDSTTYEYTLDPESGATTTGLRLNASADGYAVTAALNGSDSISTRWETGASGAGGTTGVVVVAPDGDLVWGTAAA
ncbi:hypothetical protein ACFPYI_00425 [Halomarina salina]|uniref:Uncharacterized protein n=1 Tax=Halomarina salina TaxID=1872699 RepID=A0ABD5RHV4_9EURY|nr:hypothetical protein [Halomarina salina]